VLFFGILATGTFILGLLIPQIGDRIRLVMFLSGILLYEGLTNKMLPTASKGYGLIALIIGLTIIQLLPFDMSSLTERTFVLFVTFFLLGWTCFTGLDRPSSKLFSWSPLRWLGNMSYSYYLIHGLTLQFIFLLLGKIFPPNGEGDWIYWIGLPICFLLTLIASLILFILVERPYSLFPPRLRASTKNIQATQR
jgi:peptidoglycan/LPS O-acetylase OafA/YrhL